MKSKLFIIGIILTLTSVSAHSATATPPYTWHGDRWILGDLYVGNVYGNVSGATITDVSNQIPQDDLEFILGELWARPIGGGIEHVLTDPQPFDFMVYSASTIINKSTDALGLGNAIFRDATDEVFYNLDLVSGKAVMDYVNLIENEIGPFREVYYIEGETPYSYKDHIAGVAHNNAGLVLMAGENGHIYRSVNYGLSWEDLGYQTTNVIRFIVYLGGQTWAFGDGSKIYRTLDDGDSWDVGTTTAVSQCYSMTPMLSGGAITASGNTVYRTLDAGTTWETLPVGMIGSVTPGFGSFAELLFIDTEGLGYDQVWAFGTVTGGTDVVLRSNDYGTTWTYDEVSVPAAMGEIARDSVTGNLYASQANNVVSGLDVWESTDDGLTWSPLGLDSGEYYIYKIVPLRDGRLLFCTYPTGYIYQYRDGIWTQIWSPTFHTDKEHYPEFTDYLTDLGHGVVIGVFCEHWDTGDPDWFEIEAIHVLRSDKFESLELGTAAFRDAVDEFAADETLPSGTAIWKYWQTLPLGGDHNHGTGTINQIAKFVGDATVGDSVLSEVAGSVVISASMGILRNDPVEALDFKEDARMRLSTGLTNLTQSSLIRLQWTDPDGKPAIGWFDEAGNNKAAIVAHQYLSYPDDLHQHLSFETADSLGYCQTRLEIPYGKDVVDIDIHNANFTIAGYHSLIATGTASIWGNFGMGTRNPATVADASTTLDKRGFVHRVDDGTTGQRFETYVDNLGNGRLRVMDYTGAVKAQIHSRLDQPNYFLRKTAFGKTSANYMVDILGSVNINQPVTDQYGLWFVDQQTDPPSNRTKIVLFDYNEYTGYETVAEAATGINFGLYPIVNGGHSNTGYHRGMFATVLRNASAAITNDNGSLLHMAAFTAHYGHSDTNSSAVPTTSNIYGFYLQPYQRTGTITNLYDIYIAANLTGSATVTNRYGIYQEPTDALNYLGSPLGLGVVPSSNILQVKQSSSTDPIADGWTTYSTLESKADVQPVDAQKLTTAAGRVKAVSLIEYKRPMPDEPFEPDFKDQPILDTEGNEIGTRTAKEQYEQAYKEWQAAQTNPKFTSPQIGVDANDPSIPAHWRTVDQDGKTIGVSLGAQVGDLLATVKAQQAAIEALQGEVAALKVRVGKLEGVKTP